MVSNLRARLARLRQQSEKTQNIAKAAGSGAAADSPGSIPPGWTLCAYKVLRRTFTLPLDMPAALLPAMPTVLPETLPLLIPDLNGDSAVLPKPGDFLFFDLETTGLSGGAGTVAFLAAFGRFIFDEQNQRFTDLELTQFLLLDYPGEADFLEAVLSFQKDHPGFLTTYNGKAFDIPLIKTRCLMNGIPSPRFFQADLLHPARRLWKRILPNCSQATIETAVLGLDRTGDLPGAMAPDIWFTFLRSGGEFFSSTAGSAAAALLAICDHNVKDIFGLAGLFRAFTEIAALPLEAVRRFRCDGENLALRWRRAFIKASSRRDKDTARKLLEAAAEVYPRSALRLAFDQIREGRYEEARTVLQRLGGTEPRFPLKRETTTSSEGGKGTWKVPCTAAVRALALRALAIDAVKRLQRPDLALSFLERALTPLPAVPDMPDRPLPQGLQADLERRREQLWGYSKRPSAL
ncbi:hypothetical protein AGMMS50230_14060 [Spirochaetia bacterium]|nr:hypothetical protein AGMMS50230_14060 [Spirochaetia bacterium]